METLTHSRMSDAASVAGSSARVTAHAGGRRIVAVNVRPELDGGANRRRQTATLAHSSSKRTLTVGRIVTADSPTSAVM
jgi:hypothetical protein